MTSLKERALRLVAAAESFSEGTALVVLRELRSFLEDASVAVVSSEESPDALRAEIDRIRAEIAALDAAPNAANGGLLPPLHERLEKVARGLEEDNFHVDARTVREAAALAAWCLAEAERQLADDHTDETALEMRRLALGERDL